MRGRPLCVIAIAFAVGIAGAEWFSLDLPAGFFPLIGFVLVACLIAAIRPNSHAFHLAAGIVAFTYLGLLAGRLAQPALPAPISLQAFLNKPDILVMAEVIRPPDYYPDKILLPVRLQQVITKEESFPVRGSIIVTLGRADLKPGTWLTGDRLLARVHLKPFHNFNNPGSYDYVRSQAERGFYGRAYVPDDGLLLKLAPLRNLSSIFSYFTKPLDRFRQEALMWLKANESSDVAAFYSALLLGYRHQLTDQWREHLNRAGVTHLLAISGLHLGMVSLAVFWLTSQFIRLLAPSVLQTTSDRRIALWIAFLFALMYAFVGGLALPTWRAAIMLLLICCAIYFYRPPDPATLLAAAALFILLISPNFLQQVSFQLSFAAMIGIFLFFPRFHKIEKHLFPLDHDGSFRLTSISKPFLNALLLSAAVTITVAPIIAHHFNGISVAALFANTLLVPVIGFLVLPIGLMSLVLFALNETLAIYLLKVGGWLVDLCQHVILWFSNLSWSFIWVGVVPAIWLLGFYASLALILCSWGWQKKSAALVLVVLFVCSYTFSNRISSAHGDKDRLLEVTAIDVGQGSSTLVRFPNGESMLVDGGGFFDDSFDVGRYVVAPFLWHSGIHKLDYVILSHDHPDHRNGLQFILNHFDVGCFAETGVVDENRSKSTNELRNIALKRNLPLRHFPDILVPKNIGECELEILHPTPAYLSRHWNNDLNNASLVLQIKFKKTCAIIPGDIDSSVEKVVFGHYSPCDNLLLISPHHGSASSNSKLLFDRLRPKDIVFSCGFDNWFGLPAAAVLQECNRRGIIIHRTDVHGAIKASSNGLLWNIDGYSN
ncbi:MAG: DNA internalization-related competence protein ComEC/Rec2 [Desulfoferrobacter sp.]